MADRKVSELNAATAGNLHDAALLHVVDLLEAAAADQNVKATVAQVRTAMTSAVMPLWIDDSTVEDNIPNSSIGGHKLQNTTVTEAKIGTGAVTADKIGDGEVTTAKIGTAQVTPEKTSFLPNATKIYAVVIPSGVTGYTAPTGWSVVSGGTGIFNITHNLNTTDLVIVTGSLSTQTDLIRSVQASPASADIIQSRCYTGGGSLINHTHYLLVIAY